MHFVNLRQHYSIRYLGHPVLQDVSTLQHGSTTTRTTEREGKNIECIVIRIIIIICMKTRYLLVYKYLAIIV